MLRSYVFGLVTTVAVTAACLLLFALICVSGDDPRAFADVFGIAAFILGGLSGAVVGGLLHTDEPTFGAVAPTGTYVLLTMVISWLCRTESSRPVWQGALIALVPLVCALALGRVISARRGGHGSVRRNLNKRITKR